MQTLDEMIERLENDRFGDFLDPDSLMQALKHLKEVDPNWKPSPTKK